MKRVTILALLALAMTFPLQAAMDDYQEGDSALRILGGYQGSTEIPGTETEVPPYNFHCPHAQGDDGSGSPKETEHGFLGMGYSHFLAPDVSLELSGWLPLGDAGFDTTSLSAGLNYFFGHFYIPMALQYRGDLDTLALGTGAGLDFPTAGRTIFRTELGGQYLADTDLDDQWTWSLSASVGWRLGKEY